MAKLYAHNTKFSILLNKFSKVFLRLVLLSGIVLTGTVFNLDSVQPARAAGQLTVIIDAGPNLVVDSNVLSPSSEQPPQTRQPAIQRTGRHPGLTGAHPRARDLAVTRGAVGQAREQHALAHLDVAQQQGRRAGLGHPHLAGGGYQS